MTRRTSSRLPSGARTPLPLVVALAALTMPARAQDTTSAAAPVVAASVEPPARRQVLSLQPIQAMFGIFSADYERAAGAAVTVGVGASYWDTGTLSIDDDDVLDARYTSAEVKVRYYPGETVFRGFSIGATLGGAWASFKDFDEERQHADGAKVGVELDYSWLLGRSRRMAIALGLGAKRVYYSAGGEDLTAAYPTSRIAIGWAF